jgi:hypothetical protein
MPDSSVSQHVSSRFSPTGTTWVYFAAAISFLGVFMHIAAIFGGPSWFQFFGAPPVIVESARAGTLLAPVGSSIIALLMGLCGVAATSALGVLRRLPMLRLRLALIAGVCLLRAVSVAPIAFLRPDLMSVFEVAATTLWGFAGIGFAVAFAGTKSPSQASLQVRPDPSLKLTRYGRRCKPGLRHMVHHREPGLQHLPPRTA